MVKMCLKKIITVLFSVLFVISVIPIYGVASNEEESNFSKARVGDVVQFGHYEQDSNKNNGPEDVEWFVIDKSNNQLLLLSKNILDAKPFHKTKASVTWEDCSLREWMNTTFYDELFSENESSYICTAIIDNENGRTEDNLFLLSEDEVEQLLDRRQCKCTATKHARVALGVDYDRSTYLSPWLLRTIGRNGNPMNVQTDGTIYKEGTTNIYRSDRGIRPAVWVSTTPQSNLDGEITLYNGMSNTAGTNNILQENGNSDEFSALMRSISEENPHEWKNVKQYYYQCDDYDYMIALLEDGTMKVCNPLFDFFNERFCSEIALMTDVERFVPTYSLADGIVITFIKTDGSLKVICSNDEPSSSMQKIMDKCTKFQNVTDIAYGLDDCQAVTSLYVLQSDGTVEGIGDNVQTAVSKWNHIIAIDSFMDFNVVGVKEDNTCIAVGNAFSGTQAPVYCSEIFDVSKVRDVFDVESFVSPWGVDIYFWCGGDKGNIVHYGGSTSSTQPIFYGIDTITVDNYQTCYTYALGQDGSLYSFSPLEGGVTEIANSGVKSLGVAGLALKNDGTVLHYDYNSGYISTKPTVVAGSIPSRGLKSIDYKVSDNEYFALTENNTICRIELN